MTDGTKSLSCDQTQGLLLYTIINYRLSQKACREIGEFNDLTIILTCFDSILVMQSLRVV